MQSTERWSKSLETSRMMARLAGDKVPERPFWPGRPGMWSGDNPIAADGQLRDLANQAQGAFLRALTCLSESLTSFCDHTDRDLADAEKAAREAIATIGILRTRIAGAAMPEDA